MLENINYPQDIKNFSLQELDQLAIEIRNFLIKSINKTGGHLASNLGTIDLTLALYFVFNTPDDSIIWDIGHQSYTHKILTGRKNKMNSLRKKEGLSGFTNKDESVYDIFGAGHSSTSISSAFGVAIANSIQKNKHKSIAIIGDGALTGGMAFEALNHIGDSNKDILIIINDNKMSIDKNIGGLSKHLTKLISGKIYGIMKDKSMKILDKTPSIKKFAKKSEEHLKGMFMPSSFFEELGLEYFGPIDGHNKKDLIHTLKNMKNKINPRVLHIITKKGYGLEIAENNPCKFHGISPGINLNDSLTYSNIFGNWLIDNADNKNLLAITPAMGKGSGMKNFAKKYPDKYFDVGIAEQHAITFAGGLAVKGFKPIVAIYSTFLQRGYDQLIHDIALQNLAVIFAIDRAGIVGNDGPTHNGCFDLSFLLPIPNLIITTPSSGTELYQMLNTAINTNQPFCIRYPRGKTNIDYKNNKTIVIGKAKTIIKGKKLAIFAFGNMLKIAKIAGEKLGATVIDMRFVKPLDEKIVLQIAKTHQFLISIEEGSKINGVGSLILQILNQNNLKVKLAIMGLPDKWIKQAEQQQVYEDLGLTTDGIIKVYKNLQ